MTEEVCSGGSEASGGESCWTIPGSRTPLMTARSGGELPSLRQKHTLV